jgi:cbb3-type cytochrome oxidase subunit 1
MAAAELLLRPLIALGAFALGLLAGIGRLAIFALNGVRAALTPPWYPARLLEQMGLIGWFSLPVVGLTALFGALYFMLPRLTRREWPSSSLIHAHFWLCAIGIAGYVVVMSIHGWMQGMQWNAAQMTPAQVAVAAYPWNVARSVFGGLLTLGHIVFCVHVIWMLIPRAERRDGPTLLAR